MLFEKFARSVVRNISSLGGGGLMKTFRGIGDFFSKNPRKLKKISVQEVVDPQPPGYVPDICYVDWQQ